ncbi:DUF2986 domain-containing protein [Leucothrix sargassi]|nr:DUF2986 domain-containing protein [Leucothrix sargassi]
MNRRKKEVKILKARFMKAQAKKSTKKKPKYISKADRAKMAEEEAASNESTTEES